MAHKATCVEIVLFFFLLLDTQKDTNHQFLTAMKTELPSDTSVRKINQQPTKKQLDDCNRHDLFYFIY